MTTYYEKLKSPKWQKKRLEILSERGFSCESCCNESEQLHVHHKIYKKGLNPWDYPDYNYAVLCDSCHSTAHKAIDNFNEFFGTLDVKGCFDQLGIFELILNFYFNEENFTFNSEDQTNKLISLHENGADELESHGAACGVFLRTALFMDKPNLDAIMRFRKQKLNKKDLARIFENIAVSLSDSTIDANYIESCLKLIGGDADE